MKNMDYAESEQGKAPLVIPSVVPTLNRVPLTI